ncbi:MAG: NAD-dependent epimerase/dehydratase family protein [Armatimonadota bacterium]|nr:NAD-dependent epimerase/dehydratase family protein [Armatimonadota bacterium]
MADVAGMRVLVTGAHGFVAGHLIERLVGMDADVVGVDLCARRQSYLSISEAVHSIDLVEGDIASNDQMRELFDEWRPRVVLHLAAQADVTRALADPLGTFEANVRGTYILLEHARRIWEGEDGPHAMVVASSDKAYGRHTHLPYREDDELLGLYPYDVSKACADMIARGHHVAYSMPTGVVRCANIYGPGDLNFNRIVPGTFRSLLRGERPVIRSDGTPMRDYMYIDDAADGYRRVMEAVLDGERHGEAFNFGTGEPVSVLDLFEEMVQVAQRPDLEPQVQGEASKELRDQYISAHRARRLLGWEPRTPRREGLQRTYEWYARHLPEIED